MLPASLAADVPVFIATPTSAWARAGASLVPSPVMATRRPPSCSVLIRAILSSGVASARKSSTPASSAIALAVSWLSPVIITVRMPMRRISVEPLAHPLLDDVLEVDHAECPGGCPSTRSATTSGVPPLVEMASTMRADVLGGVAAVVATHFMTAAAAPLRICRPPSRFTPLIRVCAVNGDEVGGAQLTRCPFPQAVGGLGQDHDGASLGRLVGQAGQLRGVRERAVVDAVARR